MLQKYDPNQIIIALDHKSGKVMIKGWRTDSGESLINLTKKFLAQNLNQILVTSIKRDGMLKGPDLDVISNLLSLNKIKVIASGGVRNLNDIISLKNMDVHAVIVGKAIYTGTLNLSDVISKSSNVAMVKLCDKSNSEEIINQLDKNGDIIINDKKISGSKSEVIRSLDQFFEKNNFNELKIIHSGNSENNIIYLLGEYISNDDLYKVLALIKKNSNNHTIQKLTINKKE